jgi:hypothetical protein
VQTECADIPRATAPVMSDRAGQLVRLWAVVGVAALFARASWQLGQRGVATVAAGLDPLEWFILTALTVAFVYGEGYRALQRKWIPHVFARIGRLGRERVAVYRLLAPLYAMSLVGAAKQAMLRAWLGVAAIVGAVLVVSRLPDPWRGMIDVAVASALVWGLAAILITSLRGRLSYRAATQPTIEPPRNRV